MNILIITPTNPIDIITVAQDLYANFSDSCSILSPQMFALLAEETFNHKYAVENYGFMNSFFKNPKLLERKNGQEHLIVFGNIDYRTKIKWDHIIGFCPNPDLQTEGVFDSYGEKLKEIYKESKLPDLYWVNESKIEYTFPTFKHLKLFLKTLGIKENYHDTDDSVQ